MAGYFFRYVAPKIAKNLTQRRKAKDEAFKSIDEKGKGLSLQKRSEIKKSFSGKASKIFDDASKKRKEFKKGSKLQDVMKAAARDMQKTGRGKQFRKNTFVDPKTGRIVPDTKRNVKRYEAKNGSKPDFLDLDKDGNTSESMKQAAKQAKRKK